MQLRLRLLAALYAVFCLALNPVRAQTPATGSVTISGSLQGPIYPCGNSTCPTYDSGQVTINVNGFTATANYSKAGSQKTATQIANALAAKLNTAASPVTGTVAKSKITMTTKYTGSLANYPLSTSVSYDTRFPRASFTAAPSGATLTGGTGGGSSIGTYIQQVSNNTSLCSSSTDPGGNLPYCSVFFDGFPTNPNNLGAQTLIPDSPAGHISDQSVKQLMYPGWNGRVLCHYMPWFGNSTHKNVGYNENSAATVAAQASFMIKEGCDVVLIDYYGSQDAKHAFNLATTNAMFADVSSRAGYPLKFGLEEDKGALKALCPVTGQTESATLSCLQSALMTEMDYINANYAYSPVFWTDNGQPVVAYFGGKADWPILTSADWDTLWSTVKAHTDTYSIPFKYVFQFGSFTANAYDGGRFGWVQPSAYTATQQFWWGSKTSASPTYLDSFYTAGRTHQSQLTIGALYKGFDDYNASWGTNRVIAQQCGQVLLNTANEIAKYFGGANPQIPYVQVITWNDYEEGTSVEDGIDNCYTVNSSIAGSVLNWSLTASDSIYATTSTVHHFNVYFADAGGSLSPAASNLAVTTNSLDLSALVPAGTWTMYVEMVGQPLIINRMSDGVTFIH
jgi:hypothetical protein